MNERTTVLLIPFDSGRLLPPFFASLLVRDWPKYLLQVRSFEMHFPWGARLGDGNGIIFPLFFLFLGVEALVCVNASNVDGSDMLS